MDLGRCLNDAIAVYKRNWLVLVLAMIVYELLSLVTLFILCGPLSGGLCVMMLRALARPDKSADLGDLFAAFNRFWRLLGMFWITTLATLAGTLLCVVPGIALSTIWLFCYFLAVDKDLGLWRSLGASQGIVTRKGLGANLLLCLIFIGIYLVPTAIPVLGLFLGWFVAPLAWLMVASGYVQQVHEDQGELADVLGRSSEQAG
jgi:hypothetical protein